MWLFINFHLVQTIHKQMKRIPPKMTLQIWIFIIIYVNYVNSILSFLGKRIELLWELIRISFNMKIEFQSCKARNNAYKSG